MDRATNCELRHLHYTIQTGDYISLSSWPPKGDLKTYTNVTTYLTHQY